jgi:DHA2 family multidrug resistance protein
MPVIGIILARFGPRKLLPLGLAGGAFTLFWFGQLNLNAGYWDFFWPQFIQGISLGLLFVPLTTITMDGIPREEMGNATSIFNLMRNIGGSTGIATVTTMLERHQQTLVNRLGAGIHLYNPGARSLLYQLRSGFVARGSDTTTATRRAYAAAFGLVQQHAAMLSFVQIFRFLALVFLAMIPLILIMRNPSHQRRPGSASR